MTTLTKIIVTTLLSLLFFSCNFDIHLGVKGNGIVVEQTRTINDTFNSIEVSKGLDVYLTQSDTESVMVEADENLQDVIITEVEHHVLKIHTKQIIGKSTSKKVMVSFKNISKITSTSGSDVYSKTTITAENLELTSTNGSDMTLALDTNSLVCKSSNGSDMKLTGKTIKLMAEAANGSDIKASELMAEFSQVNAYSGSDITINTSKQLIAKASGGSDINYYGNPEKVEKNNGASGSIEKK